MTDPTGFCQWVVDGKECGRRLRPTRGGRPSPRRYCYLHRSNAHDAALERRAVAAERARIAEAVEAEIALLRSLRVYNGLVSAGRILAIVNPEELDRAALPGDAP